MTLMIWRTVAALVYVALMHTAIVVELDWLRVVALAVLITLIHATLPRRWWAVGSWFASLGALAALAAFGNEMWLGFVTPVFIHSALFVLFANTLRPGYQPLIQHIALVMRPDLDAEAQEYCRSLTVAWALLFALLTVLSIVLPLTDNLVLWSWAANFGNYAAIAVLFAAEYAYRKLRFPSQDHMGFGEHLKQVIATYPKTVRRRF